MTRGFLLVGALMKYLLERNPPSLTHKRRFVFSTLLIRDNWRFQILNRAISSSKYSIMAPSKGRNYVYVLTEIYLHGSK